MVALRLFRFVSTPYETFIRLGDRNLNLVPECITEVKINSLEIAIPEEIFNKNSRQYLADPFLRILKVYVPTKTHGLTPINLDLFIPKLNFIFGLAEFNGNALVALIEQAKSRHLGYLSVKPIARNKEAISFL